MFGLEKIDWANFSLADLKEKFSVARAKDDFKKKVKKRVRFYSLLLDYINSPGNNTPDAFFTYYETVLDRRMTKFPDWVKAYMKATKSKNESATRDFLAICRKEQEKGRGFNDIMKEWLPEDEYRLLQSTRSSDISEALTILLEICNDKIENAKLIMSAIGKNLPLAGFAAGLHWFMFQFLYPSFVNTRIADSGRDPSTYSWIEENYVLYNWIGENFWLVGLTIAAIIFFFGWSLKNWHKNGLYIREQLVDYLPPYSLFKINQQYQLIMIVHSFLKSGATFAKALEQAKIGASKYMILQIDKIAQNSSVQSHVAFNIPFLGEPGNLIEERSSHVPMEEAMEGLLPRLRKLKEEKFQNTINRTMGFTIKPMIYLSFVYSIIPVGLELAKFIPDNV